MTDVIDTPHQLDIKQLPPLINTGEATPIARPASQLPEPSGYRILCALPDVEDRYESGIIKADITKHHEELLTTVLFVVSMGPDCYADPARFPSGPWCKKGDFILVRPHTGTRVKIHGKEFRIINDDCVEAVVEDPRGYARA
jgi:co-chaperonin GroES (HSP10)